MLFFFLSQSVQLSTLEQFNWKLRGIKSGIATILGGIVASRPLRYWYRNSGTHHTYRGIEGIAQHYCRVSPIIIIRPHSLIHTYSSLLVHSLGRSLWKMTKTYHSISIRSLLSSSHQLHTRCRTVLSHTDTRTQEISSMHTHDSGVKLSDISNVCDLNGVEQCPPGIAPTSSKTKQPTLKLFRPPYFARNSTCKERKMEWKWSTLAKCRICKE